MTTRATSKSFRYRANTTWTAGWRGTVSGAAKPAIITGSPPEFGGSDDVWAPEELLVSAVNTCLMLTFLKLALAKGVTPAAYESDAEGVLEMSDGVYGITAITVRPRVVLGGEGDLAVARSVMEGVDARCFMSNSIKAKVQFLAEFRVAAGK